jgi:hypothetical protein
MDYKNIRVCGQCGRTLCQPIETRHKRNWSIKKCISHLVWYLDGICNALNLHPVPTNLNASLLCENSTQTVKGKKQRVDRLRWP